MSEVRSAEPELSPGPQPESTAEKSDGDVVREFLNRKRQEANNVLKALEDPGVLKRKSIKIKNEQAEALYEKIRDGRLDAAEAENLRAKLEATLRIIDRREDALRRFEAADSDANSGTPEEWDALIKPITRADIQAEMASPEPKEA